MKISAKFRSGAGVIIAFFILAVVFASIAGVVFISINQSPGKTPEAANAYAAGNLSVETISCTDSKATVKYRWSKAYFYSAGGADGQWLDVGPDGGGWYGQAVGSATSKTVDVDKNTPLVQWRINTHYSNGAWAPSDNGPRLAINCAEVVLEQRATNLSVSNYTCDKTSGQISVKFNWTPGRESGYLVRDEQWLDISNNGLDFTDIINTSNPPSKDANSYVAGGEAGGQIGTLRGDKKILWRINTLYKNEGWHTSEPHVYNPTVCYKEYFVTAWISTNGDPRGRDKNLSFRFGPADGTVNVVFTGPTFKDTGKLSSGQDFISWARPKEGDYVGQVMKDGAKVSPEYRFRIKNRCDLNYDGAVNSGDELLIAPYLSAAHPDYRKNFGTYSHHYDVTGDGYILINDRFAIAAKNATYCY